MLQLIVTLQNRVQVEVPRLNKAIIDAVFEAHAKYAEIKGAFAKAPGDNPLSFSIPLKPDGQIIDALGSSMQHNPEQSNLPPLPPEVLEKITTVARAFGLEDTEILSQSEANCNCVFCQVVRALKKGDKEIEEEVSLADLRFRNWDISQKAEKLYHLTNPLDKNEQYDVFLGDPLGCTCGSKNCEHIRAVLTS